MVNINEKAPDFKAKALINNEEKEIKLNDFKNKKIVLYFYPKDLTPGCTTQACNLKENYDKFKKNNIIVIGVSIDSIKKHISFAEKKELPFILVSDEEKEIINKYNLWVEKSMYGRKYWGTKRTTFIIDENQIITHIIDKPKVGNHSEEIFKLLNI